MASSVGSGEKARGFYSLAILSGYHDVPFKKKQQSSPVGKILKKDSGALTIDLCFLFSVCVSGGYIVPCIFIYTISLYHMEFPFLVNKNILN